jgi:hypothetical protein
MAHAAVAPSKPEDRATSAKHPAASMPVFVKVGVPKSAWKTVPVTLTIVFSEIDKDFQWLHSVWRTTWESSFPLERS